MIFEKKTGVNNTIYNYSDTTVMDLAILDRRDVVMNYTKPVTSPYQCNDSDGFSVISVRGDNKQPLATYGFLSGTTDYSITGRNSSRIAISTAMSVAHLNDRPA